MAAGGFEGYCGWRVGVCWRDGEEEGEEAA